MPVKNTGKFLEECIDSILHQTLKRWELVVVDDNSEDNSLAILAKYARQDTRITVFKNKGSGIIAALRLAYQHSSGKYITRMDSDDIMESDKLKLLVSQLKIKGEGHLAIGLVNYFSAKKIGEGYLKYAKWLNDLTLSELNFKEIYKECTIPSPCWMVERKDFEACGGFNSDIYPEDYDLAFRFRKADLKIIAVKKVIHQWRDYEARTSRTDKNYADNRFTELKVMHFLAQDYNAKTPLVLWGAGKKGKRIAQLLNKSKTPFQWVSNNKNKIGRDIYGIILQDVFVLNQAGRAKVLIAISSPDDSEEVNQVIDKNTDHEYFRFY